MAKKKVFTAPIAIIYVNSVAVGKMKNVRLTETIRRARVTGIGRLNPEEIPPVEWTGNLSCSAYTVDFNLLMNSSQKGTFRNMTTVEAWANAILMDESGIEIAVMRKVKDGEPDPVTGLITTKEEVFARISSAFPTRESFDLQEGQISGRDTEFEYLNPVLYNLS